MLQQKKVLSVSDIWMWAERFKARAAHFPT